MIMWRAGDRPRASPWSAGSRGVRTTAANGGAGVGAPPEAATNSRRELPDGNVDAQHVDECRERGPMPRKRRTAMEVETERRMRERRARLGGQVREIRVRRRWSQTELGGRAGL